MIDVFMLIIFDYDGVIADSFSSVFNVHSRICRKMGKECPECIKEFRKIYGSCSDEYFKNMGFSEEERKKVERIYSREILKEKTKPFPGIKKVIEKLAKNHTLYVLTSGHRKNVLEKLKEFGIREHFDEVIAREKTTQRLNKTEAIRKILDKHESVVMIGDRDVDYLEAKKAGLDNVILVEYGWGYDVSYEGFTVRKPEDILKAIELVKDR